MIGVAEAIVVGALIVVFGPVALYILAAIVLVGLVKAETLYHRWVA